MSGDPGKLDALKPLRLWAEGGMGEIHLVEDDQGERYFLKRPHDNDEARRAFTQETNISLEDIHPAMTHALAAGEWQGRPALLFPYEDGTTLHALIPSLLPEPALRWIFHQTATALAALHERGWVHNDVSPSNLFLSTTGDVRVLDLGLAAPFDEEPRPANQAYHETSHAGKATGDARALVLCLLEGFRGTGLFSGNEDGERRDRMVAEELSHLRGKSPLAAALRHLWNEEQTLAEALEALPLFDEGRTKEARLHLARLVQSHRDWEAKARTQVASSLGQESTPANATHAHRVGISRAVWMVLLTLMLSTLLVIGLRLTSHLPSEPLTAKHEPKILPVWPIPSVASPARLDLRWPRKEPPQAVELDGRPLADSTGQVAVEAGTHVVRVQRDGTWHETSILAEPGVLTLLDLSRIGEP